MDADDDDDTGELSRSVIDSMDGDDRDDDDDAVHLDLPTGIARKNTLKKKPPTTDSYSSHRASSNGDDLDQGSG